MILYLIKFQLKRLRRYYQSKKAAKLITTFAFLLIFFLIALGIYKFFTEIFSYLSTEEGILLPLLLYFYEIFFLLLGLLVFLSTLVSGMFALWRGKRDEWFIASPSFAYFPGLVLTKNLGHGAWPLFVVVLPFVLAINKVFALSLSAIIFIIFSFALYFFAVIISALLFIVLGAHLYRILAEDIFSLKLNFKRLFVFLFPLFFLCSFLVWKISFSFDVITLFRADKIDAPAVAIADISKYFYYLPSHLPAKITVFWQAGLPIEALKYGFILLALCLVLLFVFSALSFSFLKLWQRLKEGANFEAGEKELKHKKWLDFRFKGSCLKALFKKELLLNIRNPRNMLWFSFLLFIWLLQAAINANLAKSLNLHGISPDMKLLAIQALQFAAAVYFASAFVLRFVFPSFSSERKTLWVLSTAPIDNKKVFYAKYVFYGIFFLLFGLTFLYFSLSVLSIGWLFIYESLFMFSAAVLLITAFGLSLGAIFPNYDSDDPGVAGTTLPGISFIIISLFYGSCGGLIIYFSEQFNTKLPLYLFITISIALIFIILLASPKMINKTKNKRNLVS